MADIKNWLEGLHLEQYYSLLINTGYTSLRACETLTDEDLSRIGVELQGHRKRIIARLPNVDEDVEYGNIVIPSSPEVHPGKNNNSIKVDPPPPRATCMPPKPKGYIHMDRLSACITTKTEKTSSLISEDDPDQIYDIPPPRRTLLPDGQGCRASQISATSSEDDYIGADPSNPPPILPPKKRLSSDDLNARLGIGQASPTEHSNMSQAGPPLMKPTKPMEDNHSKSLDSEDSSFKKKPVPKPRMSLQHKKPTPLPRIKKQIRLSKIQDSDVILEDIQYTKIEAQSYSAENQKTTPESQENVSNIEYEEIPNKKELLNKEFNPEAIYEDPNLDQPDPFHINPQKVQKITSLPKINVDDQIEYELSSSENQNVYELEPDLNGIGETFQVTSKHAEENVYEMEEEHLPSLPIPKANVSDSDSQESDTEILNAIPPPSPLRERIVIGAELSTEENDNFANEKIYQDVKMPSLNVTDYKQARGSYTGVWEMKSGSNKTGPVLINEVKPTIRPNSIKVNAVYRESFNAPPPSFAPPPLPANFKEEVLSPTLTSMPDAPQIPTAKSPPPSVPPRQAGSQKLSIHKSPPSLPSFSSVKNSEDADICRSSILSFSDFAEERNTLEKSVIDTCSGASGGAPPLPSKESPRHTQGLERKSELLEENMYSSADALPPKMRSNVSQASVNIKDLYAKSQKKPPVPPPKANPFKDFYDESRGTYCFEETITTDFAQMASGWESEDTLSDGGDFFDEDDAEFSTPISSRNASLQRMSSIPIISVTKSRILERSGYLQKKSSGKSGGNPVKASLRWQKRWVVFDSIELKYYSTNKSQISKRVIPACSIINVEQDIREGEAHPFRFTVFTIDRAYCFAAEDSKDLTLWTSLIMSAILESSTEDFPEGGDMNNPLKEGCVKMEGAKGKRYIAVKKDKFCYYNTYHDFKGGCPIHIIEMKLASVKDIGKNRLQLYTPYASYVFSFDGKEDLLSWKESFEEAIADGLGDNSVLSDVYENHSNRLCADCGAPDPHWASVNLGITLCKKCAGIHRNISIPISKVRSLRMDFKVWTPTLRQMFVKIGNDNANNFWEWNTTEDNRIDSDVEMIARKDYIIAKYKNRSYVRYHPLKSDPEALNEALCKSVQYEDVVETMQLLFSGADVYYCSPRFSTNEETPLQIAKRENQIIQMEFLRQNGAEGSGQLPVVSSPDVTLTDPVLPSRQSISLKGYLHKTGSNVKGDGIFGQEFLKRWVVLEHDILSYFENEHKQIAKDNIQSKEMLSVTTTTDDRFEFTFELATSKDHGRVYLFAAESEEERSTWMTSLAKTMAPGPEDKVSQIKDITRGGVVFVRDGLSAAYHKCWIQVELRKLIIYNQELKDFEDVDLRKIKIITMLQSSQRCSQALEDGNPFVMDLPDRALYIQSDIKKETEEWYNSIKKFSESGGTLSDQQLTSNNVPVIVEKCITYVELHGMDIEGIYRHNGQHSKVSNLLSSFHKDARSVHVSPEEYTIHDVATVLKRFFRSLEDPLLTQQLYARWIRTARMSDFNFKLQQYKQLLQELPAVNLNTLEKLKHHLAKVTQNEPVNKMGVLNIASIFGPILLNTNQTAEGGNQGFASTNFEIAVSKDMLENLESFFQVNTLDRQKEEKFLEAIKKMQMAEQGIAQTEDMLIPIHVRNRDDPNVVTHKISPDMTAQEVLSYVLKKRNLKMADNWGLYEIICNEELQRPLHYSEKVLAVTMRWSKWPAEFCVDNHLCVKKNFVYEQIDLVFDSHFSLFGELKFSEKKGFKKFCFEFSQYKLSYQKDPKALVQLGSWNVEDVTIYIGIQHKRNPATRWAFTFIQNEETVVKPFFGHSVCCNNQEELYRWIAAMYRAQHPKGLSPGTSDGAKGLSPSQLELDTLVPAGAAGAKRNQQKDKHKSSIFQKLRIKQNR